MNVTLIASVPIGPVASAVYGTAPGRALSAATRSPTAAPASFCNSTRPMTSASRAPMATTSLARWRISSAAESAPRQSSVADGPHGPVVPDEVWSIVVK